MQRAGGIAFLGFAMLWLCAACSFSRSEGGAGPATDAAVDARPPITCGDLSCDPHAECRTEPVRCACAEGYVGDGFQCEDADECATANGGCPAACVNLPEGSFTCYAPQRCTDIRIPGFAGGEVTLYVGGDPQKPWRAFCTAEMREYLTLTSQDNYSHYKGDPGEDDVRTRYSKIRLDPMALVVDISDQTYSTSTGQLRHGDNGELVTKMPYAVAMDCRDAQQPLGEGRVDLSGTPFVLDDPFEVRGFRADGNLTVMDGGRRARLSGGGNCGWISPAPSPNNPFNQTGGPILNLKYQP